MNSDLSLSCKLKATEEAYELLQRVCEKQEHELNLFREYRHLKIKAHNYLLGEAFAYAQNRIGEIGKELDALEDGK